jgi:biotin-dependent carboxylase-like uncharacterized protein
MTALRVLETGPLTLVQDAGRPGLAALGVGRSGAADRGAHALGNRLLGNRPDDASLEVLLGGLALQAEGGDAWVAVTGADVDVLVVTSGGASRPTGLSSVVRLHDGDVLRLGMARAGLRAYVAARGAIDVPAVLGSRSTDVLSGLGPDPVAAGDVLPLGPVTEDWPTIDLAPVPTPPGDTVVLRAVRGPRDDWLEDAGALVGSTWHASDRTDRVGMRLTGGELRHRWTDRQVPSEGTVRGAVQVPPSGEPVIFLADHPVTGGYPVVAVLLDEDVDRAAQVRPGQGVRLHWARS